MFPDNNEVIHSCVHQGLGMNEIIDIIIDNPASTLALSHDLNEHANKFFNQSQQHHISTTRSCVFNCAQSFYKRAKTQPALLRTNLKIEFGGEDGVDSGALRKEFFLHFLQTADERFVNCFISKLDEDQFVCVKC